jgi:hypothetical protein
MLRRALRATIKGASYFHLKSNRCRWNAVLRAHFVERDVSSSRRCIFWDKGSGWVECGHVEPKVVNSDMGSSTVAAEHQNV